MKNKDYKTIHVITPETDEEYDMNRFVILIFHSNILLYLSPKSSSRFRLPLICDIISGGIFSTSFL